MAQNATPQRRNVVPSRLAKRVIPKIIDEYDWQQVLYELKEGYDWSTDSETASLQDFPEKQTKDEQKATLRTHYEREKREFIQHKQLKKEFRTTEIEEWLQGFIELLTISIRDQQNISPYRLFRDQALCLSPLKSKVPANHQLHFENYVAAELWRGYLFGDYQLPLSKLPEPMTPFPLGSGSEKRPEGAIEQGKDKQREETFESYFGKSSLPLVQKSVDLSKYLHISLAQFGQKTYETKWKCLLIALFPREGSQEYQLLESKDEFDSNLFKYFKNRIWTWSNDLSVTEPTPSIERWIDQRCNILAAAINEQSDFSFWAATKFPKPRFEGSGEEQTRQQLRFYGDELTARKALLYHLLLNPPAWLQTSQNNKPESQQVEAMKKRTTLENKRPFIVIDDDKTIVVDGKCLYKRQSQKSKALTRFVRQLQRSGVREFPKPQYCSKSFEKIICKINEEFRSRCHREGQLISTSHGTIRLLFDA